MAKNKNTITKDESIQEYIANQSLRIGSNKDGTPRLNFIKGEPISLTLEQAEIYKKLLK